MSEESKNPHDGSTLESFLKEEGIYEDLLNDLANRPDLVRRFKYGDEGLPKEE